MPLLPYTKEQYDDVDKTLTYMQERYGFLSEDTPLTRDLQQYLDRMQELRGDERKLKVIIAVNTDEINAFSLPDGHIVMTWAMVSALYGDAVRGDKGELVGILLHERNHFVRLHHDRTLRITKDYRLAIQRFHEYEADESDFDLMVDLGFNPFDQIERAFRSKQTSRKERLRVGSRVRQLTHHSSEGARAIQRLPGIHKKETTRRRPL